MAMAAVIIGVDPHKGSHTAVAVGGDEMPLGQVRVRACDAQAGQLLDWAAAWPDRTWAVEGARGMGSWTCSRNSGPGSGCWPPGT
jgi:transposase